MEDGSGVRTRTWTVRRPPLSPPAGVAPFAGVGHPCSQPFLLLRSGPANLGPGGRAPGTPTFEGSRVRVRGLAWARWDGLAGARSDGSRVRVRRLAWALWQLA